MRRVMVAASLVFVSACAHTSPESAASPSPSVPPFYVSCDQIANAIGYFGAYRVWYDQADQFSRDNVQGKPLDQLIADEAWPIFKSLQGRWVQCSLKIPNSALRFIQSGNRLIGA